MNAILSPAIGLVVALVATRIMISLAPQLGLVDTPNERSIHALPVATLGGVGIVLGVFVSVIVQVLTTDARPVSLWPLFGAGLILLVLIKDEWQALAWGTKLVVQGVAAAVIVGSLEGTNIFLTGDVVPVWAGRALCLVTLVYFQNIYNFMDGLDGLGGMHGVLVGGILFVLFAPVSPFLSILCLSISTASLGFLIWNIPPARIFMGDVGAHFLGLVFVWIALVGEGMGVPVGVTLLSLGAFIFDSSFTLCRRLLRGENLIKAHRFHLYQRLEQSGVSPLKVDGIYVVWTALFGLVAFAVQASSYQGLACATAIAFTLGMTVITEYRWMRVVKES